MKVEVIAYTSLWDVTEMRKTMSIDMSAKTGETVIEFAGRSCYQSFHKPNAATRANRDYIANILAQQHESVLEHSSVSFYVTGVSRNMLLELERHRHLSFSVESQRFVDSKDGYFIAPPALQELEYDVDLDDSIYQALKTAREAYVALEEALGDLPRKQRREAARSVLPGGMETKFVVTGNMRAWRDVLRKRYSTHADAEIRLFASEVLRLMKTEVAPNVFQDFPNVPFD